MQRLAQAFLFSVVDADSRTRNEHVVILSRCYFRYVCQILASVLFRVPSRRGSLTLSRWCAPERQHDLAGIICDLPPSGLYLELPRSRLRLD
jgi:hypothetical protein